MKNNSFSTITIVLLTLTVSMAIIVASFLTPATAQPPSIEDVIVPRLLNLVTLDGVIIGEEWSDAVELPVTFRFYNSTTPPYEIVENRTGFIYLKHDCVDLWTCILMEDPIENLTIWDTYPSGEPSVMGDMMWIFYDASGDMTPSESGDDEKGVLHPDFTFDSAIIPTPPGYDEDTNLGGTKDIDGASGWADGWITIEMVHPLNSGDSAGNDPSLYPGDEILAEYIVMDPEVDIMLYGMAYTEQWAYLLNLITTPCPVGGSIIPLDRVALFLAAITVIGIVVATPLLLKRRRG